MELIVRMDRGMRGGTRCDSPPGGGMLEPTPIGPGPGGGGGPPPPNPRPGGRLDPMFGGGPNGFDPIGGGLTFFGGSG